MRYPLIAFVIFAVSACASSITPLPSSTVTPRAHPRPSMPESNLPDLPSAALPLPKQPPAHEIRVALNLNAPYADVTASGGAWAVYDYTGETLLASAGEGDVISVSSENGWVAVSAFGSTQSFQGGVIVRPDESTLMVFNGKRYRGQLILVANERRGLTVVNELAVEEYLRGVVPLEIGGDRAPEEIEAVAAQAIAARSYAYHLMNKANLYDVSATVQHQVYGGVDAERPLSDKAIARTRGLVVMYNGEIALTPYHSNSGGATASASEAWKSEGLPYLVSVSDIIPGTDRFYCEESPRFSWSRTFSAGGLVGVLNETLHRYSSAPKGGIKKVVNITEAGRTASGRVSRLIIETNRGKYTVNGSDIRSVLRSTGGGLLPSTKFQLKVERSSGAVTKLVINGNGNGHGVGMDQWGAISRARAGQDFVTILRTYYPGTTIGAVL